MRSSVRIRPPRPLRPRPSSGRADRHPDRLDAVVAHALVVPGRVKRLDDAIRVGGATRQLVLARLGIPGERPAPPRPVAERRIEARLGPPPVDADLDPADGPPATPGATADGHVPGIDEPPPGEIVRDPRRGHQRADADPGYRLPGIVRVLLVVIRGRLLVAGERLGDGLDPA